MPNHDDLLSQAKKAIEDLFSDTSVEQSVTRSDLLELRDDITELLGLVGHSDW